VCAPGNRSKPALTSIVKYKGSVMDLISLSYAGHLTGFNQEADRSARSFVEYHGRWDSPVFHYARASQCQGGNRTESRLRTRQLKLKWKLIGKPGGNGFRRSRTDFRTQATIDISVVVRYGGVQITGCANPLHDVRAAIRQSTIARAGGASIFQRCNPSKAWRRQFHCERYRAECISIAPKTSIHSAAGAGYKGRGVRKRLDNACSCLTRP
jgi:hypothetical protein